MMLFQIRHCLKLASFVYDAGFGSGAGFGFVSDASCIYDAGFRLMLALSLTQALDLRLLCLLYN